MWGSASAATRPPRSGWCAAGGRRGLLLLRRLASAGAGAAPPSRGDGPPAAKKLRPETRQAIYAREDRIRSEIAFTGYWREASQRRLDDAAEARAAAAAAPLSSGARSAALVASLLAAARGDDTAAAPGPLALLDDTGRRGADRRRADGDEPCGDGRRVSRRTDGGPDATADEHPQRGGHDDGLLPAPLADAAERADGDHGALSGGPAGVLSGAAAAGRLLPAAARLEAVRARVRRRDREAREAELEARAHAAWL